MTSNLSVRLKEDNLKELDKLTKLIGVDRAIIVRGIIKIGRETKKIDVAIKRFQKGSTLEQAANITNISLWDLIDEVKKRGITSKSDLEQTKYMIIRSIAKDDENLAKRIKELSFNP